MGDCRTIDVDARIGCSRREKSVCQIADGATDLEYPRLPAIAVKSKMLLVSRTTEKVLKDQPRARKAGLSQEGHELAVCFSAKHAMALRRSRGCKRSLTPNPWQGNKPTAA